MDPIDLHVPKLTSVSIRSDSFGQMKSAQTVLAGKAIIRTEQEMFRDLLQIYLCKWRGGGSRTSSLRRYNLKGKNYIIKSLYIESGFSAALWTRAVHSGVTISRMLDFAIRYYLSTYVNQQYSLLAGISTGELSIQYQCNTWKNSGSNLQFVQMIAYLLPQAMPP